MSAQAMWGSVKESCDAGYVVHAWIP